MSEILSLISSAAAASALASLISAIYVAIKVRNTPGKAEPLSNPEDIRLEELIKILKDLQEENKEMKSELLLSRAEGRFEIKKIKQIEDTLVDMYKIQIKEHDLLQDIQVEIKQIESISNGPTENSVNSPKAV